MNWLIGKILDWLKRRIHRHEWGPFYESKEPFEGYSALRWQKHDCQTCGVREKKKSYPQYS